METLKSESSRRTLLFLYRPGKFADLAALPFSQVLWEYLTRQETLDLMSAAAEEGQPAILPLDATLRKLFSRHGMDSFNELERLKTMSLNMVKQLLEENGYSHIACAFLPQGNFFKTAAVFQKC